MIELEKTADDLWSDESSSHVIVHEDWEHPVHAPGFYVRDDLGPERGPFDDLAQALEVARAVWGEVTLAPANRLRETIETGRADEVGHFLLEYLADHGTAGIDAQALAKRVYERIEEA